MTDDQLRLKRDQVLAKAQAIWDAAHAAPQRPTHRLPGQPGVRAAAFTKKEFRVWNELRSQAARIDRELVKRAAARE